MNNFAVFILTHGRPDNVITYKTLKHCGYTGPIYFIVDNEDKTIDKYYKNFGKDRVIVFDKKYYADSIDEGNNFDERRTITHARNACFDIAEKLEIEYFIQLDDDYVDFRYKKDGQFNNINKRDILNMDKVFNYLILFYRRYNFLSVAISQGGDFLGGKDGNAAKNPQYRKCMNSFVCSTKRKFQFIGAMNEDVNTYTTLGSRGGMFFNIPVIALQQRQTQKQVGGITEMYLRFGTYCKAFTTVMMMPSSVKVSVIISNHRRIHHSINWKNTVPMIINEKYKQIDNSLDNEDSFY